MAKFTYQERILTNTERRFMLNAERGDCASVAKIIEQSKGERLRDTRYSSEWEIKVLTQTHIHNSKVVFNRDVGLSRSIF